MGGIRARIGWHFQKYLKHRSFEHIVDDNKMMPPIKNIFDEIRLKQHDEDYEPRREGLPTGAKAGSLEKLFVIADRVEKGERLFHPGDNPILATIAEEFEKAKFINKLFREKRQVRVARRKANG